jgi:hypothetical protein
VQGEIRISYFVYRISHDSIGRIVKKRRTKDGDREAEGIRIVYRVLRKELVSWLVRVTWLAG